MADSSLLAIQQKVRRLTRSLTEAQLTTPQLNQYINTYVLYDFPETLKLFNLRATLDFYTTPFVDVYQTDPVVNPLLDVQSPLYNFVNKYTFTDSPIYIGGYAALFSQSREQFFGIYPLVNSIASIGRFGNGVLQTYSGVINSQQANIPLNSTQVISLLQRNVMFSSIDINSNGLAMQDSPILDATSGLPTIFGLLYNPYVHNDQPYNVVTNPGGYPVLSLTTPYKTQPGFPNNNYINYVTGEFTVTFPTAPASGVLINSQTVPQNPTIPQALLFYDGQFTVRPVPDMPYKINMEVYVQPTELLATTQNPELNEWWQLIAFNASKKIFEDRMDYDSLNMMMPSLKEQERLVLRRTIVQQTTQRGSTIYSDQNGAGQYGSGWFNGGGSF